MRTLDSISEPVGDSAPSSSSPGAAEERFEPEVDHEEGLHSYDEDQMGIPSPPPPPPPLPPPPVDDALTAIPRKGARKGGKEPKVPRGISSDPNRTLPINPESHSNQLHPTTLLHSVQSFPNTTQSDPTPPHPKEPRGARGKKRQISCGPMPEAALLRDAASEADAEGGRREGKRQVRPIALSTSRITLSPPPPPTSLTPFGAPCNTSQLTPSHLVTVLLLPVALPPSRFLAQ